MDVSGETGRAPAAGDGVAGAFIAFVAVLAYVLLFRGYGFDPFDEGTLLAQIDRVRRGEVPYRDFHTGYTPGLFYLNAWLFEVFGVHVQVVRSMLAVLHAAEMAALYWLARRLTGAGTASAVVALCVVAFRPIATGAFALFNIPYAGWYAQALAGVALVGTLLASSRDRGWVGVGVLWGLVFCFKQNAGLFGLGAVTCFVALDDRSGRRTMLGGLALALALLTGGGIVLRAGASTAWTAVVVGTGLVPLAAAVVRSRPGAGFLRREARLLVGFALVAVPMLVTAVLVAGLGSVLASVFHVGSGAAAVYAEPYPSLAEARSALAAAPASLRAARQAFETILLLVLPCAAAAAACMLAWRPARAPSARRLLVCAGVLSLLQMLPRADFWHLAHLAGPLLLLAVVMVVDVGRRLRLAPVVVALGLWLLVLVRALPTGALVIACLRPPPATDLPVLARADLRWDLVTDETLREVPDVVRALAGARTMVGFPALSGLGFLASAPSPLPHDYFFPGLLDTNERAAVVALLESAPPDAAVILRDQRAFAAEAARDYATLVRLLEEMLPIAERIGPFEVRRREAP